MESAGSPQYHTRIMSWRRISLESCGKMPPPLPILLLPIIPFLLSPGGNLGAVYQIILGKRASEFNQGFKAGSAAV